MLGLKLNHVSKRGHWYLGECVGENLSTLMLSYVCAWGVSFSSLGYKQRQCDKFKENSGRGQGKVNVKEN